MVLSKLFFQNFYFSFFQVPGLGYVYCTYYLIAGVGNLRPASMLFIQMECGPRKKKLQSASM